MNTTRKESFKPLEDKNLEWADLVRRKLLLRKSFAAWKEKCQSLNPAPLTKGSAVFAAFKWVSLTLGSSGNLRLIDQVNDDPLPLSEQHQPRYSFPYYLAKEQDGSVSQYFMSRVRRYVVQELQVSHERFPLFIHAIALLDAHQMMRCFQTLKLNHLRYQTLTHLIRRKALQRHYYRWQEATVRMQRLKDTFSLVKAMTKYRRLFRHFRYWRIAYQLLLHLEDRVIPRLFHSSLSRWLTSSRNRVLARMADRSATSFRIRETLRRFYGRWIRKLIPLRTPFLLLHSSSFLHLLSLFVQWQWHASLSRQSLYHQDRLHRSKLFTSHPLLRHFFGIGGEPELATATSSSSYVEKIRHIIATIQQNLSSVHSQLFLLHLAEVYFEKKRLFLALKRWQWRAPQLSLDASSYHSPHKLNHLSNRSLRLSSNQRTTFRLFQIWKCGALKRNVARKSVLMIRLRQQRRLTAQYFGLWLIVTAKFQSLTNNFLRLSVKRCQLDAYFALFAWRNQYERSVLLRKNQKTLLLLRNQEIQEFADYLTEITSARERDILASQSRHPMAWILRRWALYVRDRNKGKRLYSLWFRFAGKNAVYRSFYRWRTLYQHYYMQSVCIQKTWRGYRVRAIQYPRRSSFLLYFRQHCPDITRFVRRQRQSKVLRILLRNLLSEKDKHLLQLRGYWAKRLFFSLYGRWRKKKRQETRVNFFCSFFPNKFWRRRALQRWKKYVARKRFLSVYKSYLLKSRLSPYLKFWRFGIVHRRRQIKAIIHHYLPSKMLTAAVRQWRDSCRRHAILLWQAKLVTQHLKTVALDRWRHFLFICHNTREIAEHRLHRRARRCLKRWRDDCAYHRDLRRYSEWADSRRTKKKFFRLFLQHMRKDLAYREDKKPFLLKKYEAEGVGRWGVGKVKGKGLPPLNSLQRKMVNYLSKKFVLGNVVLTKALKTWRDFNLRHHLTSHLLTEKLRLFQKKKLLTYFKRLLLPLRRKHYPRHRSDNKYPTENSYLLHRAGVPMTSYYHFLSSQHNLYNRQVRKMRAEKAVKTRLYLIPRHHPERHTLFHYLHRLMLYCQAREKRRRFLRHHFLRFQQRQFRIFLFDKLRPRCVRSRKVTRVLTPFYLEKRRKSLREFFAILRFRLKQKRRQRHLLKLFLIGFSEMLKKNLSLQKLKKFTYLRKKKIFSIERNEATVSRGTAMTWNDLYEKSTYLYPDYKYSPRRYQVNLVRDLNTSSHNSHPSSSTLLPPRKPSAASYSLFYFQQEQQRQQRFKVIGKLQRRCHHFLSLLRLNVQNRREFRRLKGKRLQERWRHYRIVQFRRFRSSLEKLFLHRQIMRILAKKQNRRLQRMTLHYLRRRAQLRKRFFLVKKRFSLLPVFQSWLLLTIAQLKHQRILTKTQRVRQQRVKSKIFSAWKSLCRTTLFHRHCFEVIFTQHLQLQKKRIFYTWILTLDQKVLTQKFLQVQSRHRHFQLQNLFHLWQKALFRSEMFTWKNAQVGFRNWRLLVRSRTHRKAVIKQAEIFLYLRTLRYLFDRLQWKRHRRAFVRHRLTRMVRKQMLQAILRCLRRWKRRMYWKTRTTLLLRHRPHHRYLQQLHRHPVNAYRLHTALHHWLRRARERRGTRRMRVLTKIYMRWKDFSQRQSLRRQAFKDRIELFRRRHLYSLIWRPLHQHYRVTKASLALRRGLEEKCLTQTLRHWRSCFSRLDRKRHLVQQLLNYVFYEPLRQLYWKRWKVVTFHTDKLLLMAAKKSAFSSWRKLFIARRYSYYYRLGDALRRWKHVIAHREATQHILQRRRDLLFHLLLKRLTSFLFLQKSAFSFWKIVTISTFYRTSSTSTSSSVASTPIDWKSFLQTTSSEVSPRHPLMTELLQRRNHSSLLRQIRQSQMGRVLIFGAAQKADVLEEEAVTETKATIEGEEERRGAFISALNYLKLPHSIVSLQSYQRQCSEEVKAYERNRSKHRHFHEMRRNDPFSRQETILADQTIPIRRKLDLFLQDPPPHRQSRVSREEEDWEEEERKREGTIAVPFSDKQRRQISRQDKSLTFIGIRQKK